MRAALAAWALALGASAQDLPYEASAHHVRCEDGTRLAVDVYLPADRAPDATLPALLELTRYWRAREDPATGEVARLFTPSAWTRLMWFLDLETTALVLVCDGWEQRLFLPTRAELRRAAETLGPRLGDRLRVEPGLVPGRRGRGG